ncbi:MAG: hypothetical protein R2706_18725 [Acidimicrobiales bacterium]
MSDISIREIVPAALAPATPNRPRLLVIGTALASAAVIVGFGSLLSFYVRTRALWLASDSGTWLPSGVNIPLTQPNMMAITLVFSLITVVWAVASMKSDDRSNTYIAVGLSIMFGFAYIAQTAYLLSLMGLPIAGDDAGRAPLFFAVIGSHLAITGAAMAYLAIMGIRSLGGNYNAKDVEGLYGAAMFWFVTVALYFAMWYAIYITK